MTGSEVIVRPITGEIVELGELSGERLAVELDIVADHVGRLDAYRQAIADEVARRADGLAKRKVTIDGVTFEVNPPTEDHYDPDLVEQTLAPLVTDGQLTPELMRELIVTPEPTYPPRRVDKRRINALWKSDNRQVLAALARCRRRVDTKRTAKVIARAINTTAEEDTP